MNIILIYFKCYFVVAKNIIYVIETSKYRNIHNKINKYQVHLLRRFPVCDRFILYHIFLLKFACKLDPDFGSLEKKKAGANEYLEIF